MSNFEKQGNGEKEIPIDSGDRAPKFKNRVFLLSPVRIESGSVGIVFDDLCQKEGAIKTVSKEQENP